VYEGALRRILFCSWDMKLVYRGQLIQQAAAGGFGRYSCDGEDLRAAMDAVIAGKRPTQIISGFAWGWQYQ